MAVIQSGASATQLTIDTTSDAARVTQYDTNGNPMSDVSSLSNVLNALNSAVTITLGGQSTLGINVVSTSGTLTLSFEATIDNSTWVALNATPVAGGAAVTSTSANGQWVASASGYYAVRARISAFTSGSMTVSLVATPGTSTIPAVAVSGTVTANAGSGTFTVGGTVTANQTTDAAPATQNITAQDTASTSTAGTNGQFLVTGSPTANSAASFAISTIATIKVQVTGSWTGTLVVETSVDSGTTWVATDIHLTGVTSATNAFTTNFVGSLNVSGCTNARVRATTAWTGTATVKFIESVTSGGVVASTPLTSDLNFSGSISANGGSVVISTQGMSVLSTQVTGTWSGVLIPQFSIDGTTWINDTVMNNNGDALITNITSNITYVATVGGQYLYRIWASSWSSGTANIWYDGGVGTNVIVAQSQIYDGYHGPAAVKAASTAPAAIDQSLVVAMSTNSIAAQDRSTITPGTKQIAVIGGMDGIGGIARVARLGEYGTQRTTSENTLWHDAFEGTTVNAFWTQSTTTMTIAQTTGVLTLNNSGITTLNTDAIITSQRQFPKYPRNPLYCRFRANISANAAANHTLVELGLGAPSGVTATITTGAFFRWTAAGNLNAVISFNGTEQSTQVLAQGTISTTEYYFYDIIADDDFVRYIVSDSSGVPIVDTQVSVTNTVANLLSVSHIPSFARVYVDATGGGTTIKLNLSAHSVQILDALINKPWNDQQAQSMRVATVNPTTYATTVTSFTGAPATQTPANATAGQSFLGGEYAFTTVVAFETGASIFAFQVPSPYTLMLTGIQIPAPVVATTISATGIPYIEWFIVFNGTTNTLSTAGGFRQSCGIVHAAPTASAAQGSVWNGGLGIWTPKNPIPCLPGTFVHVGFKILGSTAVATAGLHRGTVTVDAYWE